MSTTGRKSWYEEGLQFSCSGCGRCCRGPGGFVWVEAEEISVLAKALDLDEEAFGKKYLRRSGMRLCLLDNAKGDCILLNEEGRCVVYEVRPLQCRTWPWWPENVKNRKAWELTGTDCPGIDKGPTHTESAIDDVITQMNKK